VEDFTREQYLGAPACHGLLMIQMPLQSSSAGIIGTTS
jgi:hypothetical protein